MLELSHVKKSYPQPDGTRLSILDVESFRVGRGEQMVLVGESGSGKTTLLQIIAGLLRPDSGSVKVADVDLARLSEVARDRFRALHLGYVYQTFNLLPGFSALENVLLGMSFGGTKCDDERAAKLLGRVGLAHRLTHRPAHLSVGEQQRVAVARALVNRPKLILADEPTANVDPKHQQQIVDLLREACREENVSLMIVTHSPHVAEQFDRVEKLTDFNKAVAA